MNKDSDFFKQTALLLKVLPCVFEEEVFALKGGTAINMFVRNLPRLSVDIDLTYLPLDSRDNSLVDISFRMSRIAEKIPTLFPQVSTFIERTKEGHVVRIIVFDSTAKIKIEVNHILRGHLYEVQTRMLCEDAQAQFEIAASVACLHFDELYAGKMCAALDRQHPRDLFDIKILLENEGINDSLRKAFIVYLISNNRPISELINPNRLDQKELFNNEFLGMTNKEFSYNDFVKAREQLINHIVSDFTNDERQFLISFKAALPQWKLLGIDGVEKWPSILWKLMNIKKMDLKKHQIQLEKLKNKLQL